MQLRRASNRYFRVPAAPFRTGKGGHSTAEAIAKGTGEEYVGMARISPLPTAWHQPVGRIPVCQRTKVPGPSFHPARDEDAGYDGRPPSTCGGPDP